MNKPKTNSWLSPLAVGAYFAVLTLLLHFVFNSNYGYFRDELYYIACGEHLAWGYPDHAPMVALLAKTSRILFGDSLFGLRVFPAVFGAAKVFLTALLVKAFGGKRFATFLACLCVLCAPVYLAIDNFLSMNSLEPVLWMLCAYFAVLAIKRENSRYWLWFGLVAGLGLMTKHSMLFFGCSLVAGLLATYPRKVFLDKCFWLGGIIAILIFTPNIIWQFQNNFATLELLRTVQESGKNVVLPPLQFFVSQIMTLLPLTFPVWFLGIWFFLFDKNGKRFRFLGVAYLLLLALMIYLKAKDYYLVPIYPMMFAGGAVWWEQIIVKFRALRLLKYALPLIILIPAIAAAPTVLPILPIETLLSYQRAIGFTPPKSETEFDSPLQQIFSDELGWQEMVEKVADVYNQLPPEERAKAGIYGSNYGQASAIDFFGAKYGLPKSISPHQSYFLWGPRGYTGEILILLGSSKENAERKCNSVEEKTEVNYPYTEGYEKYHILICRQTKKPLPEIWQSLKFWY